MHHFHTRFSVAALVVELLLFRAAVEDRLRAAGSLGDAVESLEHKETQTLALVRLRDADFFDVADNGTVVNAKIGNC